MQVNKKPTKSQPKSSTSKPEYFFGGLDFSLTSPAVCYSKSKIFNIEDCDFFFFVKKNQQLFSYKMSFEKSKPVLTKTGVTIYKDKTTLTRARSIYQALSRKCESVAIEGYSYGSFAKSTSILDTAEAVGIYKYLYKQQHDQKFILASPKTIKKFATESGNANKLQMSDQFKRETNLDLTLVFNKKTCLIQPIPDIVDSYFICKWCANGQ